MKATVDAVGRIVIPKRIRDRLGIEVGAELEVVETETGIRVEVASVTPRIVRSAGRRVVKTGKALSAEAALAVRDELRR